MKILNFKRQDGERKMKGRAKKESFVTNKEDIQAKIKVSSQKRQHNKKDKVVTKHPGDLLEIGFRVRALGVGHYLLGNKNLFEAEMASRLPLRMALFSLLVCCDSKGRFCWQPRRLKLFLLPFDDVDIVEVLEALCACGFIEKYEEEGKLYGYIALADVES